jgi:hypothetical protein
LRFARSPHGAAAPQTLPVSRHNLVSSFVSAKLWPVSASVASWPVSCRKMGDDLVAHGGSVSSEGFGFDNFIVTYNCALYLKNLISC